MGLSQFLIWYGVQGSSERYFVPLKHKDSFGKSENLSKTFYAEILVFHPDYEYKSLSSNGSKGLRTSLSIHVMNYTLHGVFIIKSFI